MKPRIGDLFDNFGEKLRVTRVSRDGRSVVMGVVSEDGFGKETVHSHREYVGNSLPGHLRYLEGARGRRR